MARPKKDLRLSSLGVGKPDVTLRQIAEENDVSRQTVRRRIKEATGMSYEQLRDINRPKGEAPGDR